MKTFTMAKKGELSGLNKKEATVVQSSVKALKPRPLMPEPIWWTVTEWGKAKHTKEMLCKVWKRYPGNTYQQKLQTNTITKNFTRDMRRVPSFSSFSCKVLEYQQ